MGADLREQYGRKWRSKTPRRERVMLRMGELVPATEQETPTAPPPAPRSVAPRPRPRRQTNPKAKGRPQRTFEDLLTESRATTVQWADADLTAERIRTAVHVSQANARKLREALKAERSDGHPLHSVGAPASDGPTAEAA